MLLIVNLIILIHLNIYSKLIDVIFFQYYPWLYLYWLYLIEITK